jgi:hypothetical protein
MTPGGFHAFAGPRARMHGSPCQGATLDWVGNILSGGQELLEGRDGNHGLSCVGVHGSHPQGRRGGSDPDACIVILTAMAQRQAAPVMNAPQCCTRLAFWGEQPRSAPSSGSGRCGGAAPCAALGPHGASANRPVGVWPGAMGNIELASCWTWEQGPADGQHAVRARGELLLVPGGSFRSCVSHPGRPCCCSPPQPHGAFCVQQVIILRLLLLACCIIALRPLSAALYRLLRVLDLHLPAAHGGARHAGCPGVWAVHWARCPCRAGKRLLGRVPPTKHGGARVSAALVGWSGGGCWAPGAYGQRAPVICRGARVEPSHHCPF